MNVKANWTDHDFDEMGWHDSLIHAISFPNSDSKLSFDLDYIFEWIINKETSSYGFWVSPCILTFTDVSELIVKMDFGATIGLDIEQLARRNPVLSPNGQVTIWHYEISTSCGTIEFKSSGFNQAVKKPPVFVHSQALERDEW